MRTSLGVVMRIVIELSCWPDTKSRVFQQPASRPSEMPTIRIGHSPDPDDAFMFYALTAGKVRIPDVRIEHVLEDIESLNRRARTAQLEVTAGHFRPDLPRAGPARTIDPG